ncbi:MAG: hypothetical protein WBA84_06750 [Carnobacterium sp.]|uniref:hypothetical protein n=1 Tax=Carnobacterium sp. TaxID=48221 RepID=UPI003C71E03E
MPAKEYALYKGENMLAIGTLQEIANEMKIKLSSVRYIKTPSYQKRGTGKNRHVLVDLEETK